MLPTEVNQLELVRWDRILTGTCVSLASDAALRVITPRVGPTGTLFLHRCARRPTPVEHTTFADLAVELGVAPRVMVNTIERVIRFGFARWADTGCQRLEVATEFGFGPPTNGGTPAAQLRPEPVRAA